MKKRTVFLTLVVFLVVASLAWAAEIGFFWRATKTGLDAISNSKKVAGSPGIVATSGGVFRFYRYSGTAWVEGTVGSVGTASVLDDTTSTVVSDTNVTASSQVFLFPSNSVAAALTGVYVASEDNVAGTSFKIHHPDPGGTGTFNYWVVK